MTDLPRLFRPDPEREDWEQYWNPEFNIFDGWLVPVDLDTTVQAIADAWWGMTEEQQIAIGEICEGYEDDAALDVLLDTLKQTALTEENNDHILKLLDSTSEGSTVYGTDTWFENLSEENSDD